ncbi:MAG: hypothetical protein GF381_01055 [Candidatus Pacebacteria bacterium]|nr:hypothetical protein [Candidatus Paceibacterota bacterium]
MRNPDRRPGLLRYVQDKYNYPRTKIRNLLLLLTTFTTWTLGATGCYSETRTPDLPNSEDGPALTVTEAPFTGTPPEEPTGEPTPLIQTTITPTAPPTNLPEEERIQLEDKLAVQARRMTDELGAFGIDNFEGIEQRIEIINTGVLTETQEYSGTVELTGTIKIEVIYYVVTGDSVILQLEDDTIETVAQGSILMIDPISGDLVIADPSAQFATLEFEEIRESNVEPGDLVFLGQGENRQVYKPGEGWSPVEYEEIENPQVLIETNLEIENASSFPYGEIVFTEQGEEILSKIILNTFSGPSQQGHFGTTEEEIIQYLEENDGWLRGARLPQLQMVDGEYIDRIESSAPVDINLRVPFTFILKDSFQEGMIPTSDDESSGVQFVVDTSGGLVVRYYSETLLGNYQYAEHENFYPIAVTRGLVHLLAMIEFFPPVSRQELVDDGVLYSNNDYSIPGRFAFLVHFALGGRGGGTIDIKDAMMDHIEQRGFEVEAGEWLNPEYRYSDVTTVSGDQEDWTSSLFNIDSNED